MKEECGCEKMVLRQLIVSYKVCHYIDGRLLRTVGQLSIFQLKSSSQLIAGSRLE